MSDGIARWFLLLVISLTLSVLATACGVADEAGSPAQVEGPALVMFYTDN